VKCDLAVWSSRKGNVTSSTASSRWVLAEPVFAGMSYRKGVSEYF